jgi:hypothetical protein
MNRGTLGLFLLFVLVVLMTGCGGGAGGSSTPPVFISITPTTLPYGVIGQAYQGAQMTATGGTPPYSWSATAVPDGMTFNSSGTLAGTPGTATTFRINITANDSAGHSTTSHLDLPIYRPLSAAIPYPEIISGVPYEGWIVLDSGNAPITPKGKLLTGTLPPGLAIGTPSESTGLARLPLTGTPVQGGVFDFTMEVSDTLSPPRLVQIPLRMFVDLQELQFNGITDLPRVKRADPYSFVLTTRGGVAPITCGAAPGSSLPPGLEFNNNCVLAGTPTAVGQFSFMVRATDSGTTHQTINKTFTLTVIEPLAVNPFPNMTTGESYAFALPLTGGTPPYFIGAANPGTCCYTVERHDLTLHAVPYVAGQQSIQLNIQDAAGQVINPTIQFNVAEGPFRLGPDDLPRMSLNRPYDGFLFAISGKPPVTWSVVSGSLPPQIVLLNYSDGAQFSGTPISVGTYSATVQATDSSIPPKTLQVPLSFQVNDKLPRNDSVITSDFLSGASNKSLHLAGALRSISPFADPEDLLNPDQDYYHARALAGETIEVGATRQGPAYVIDPVIEIVDANGQRFNTCRNPEDDTPDLDGNVDPTPLAFDDACMNDDMVPGQYTDSKLHFRVPGASGTTVEYFVHVLDFRGAARPDFRYDVYIYHYVPIVN